MKLKFIPIFVAIAMSLILAYMWFNFCSNADLQRILTIVGFFSIVFPLSAALGVSLKDTRKSVNIKVLSFICSISALVMNTIFAFTLNSMPILIICDSILFLLWLLAVYAIAVIKQ